MALVWSSSPSNFILKSTNNLFRFPLQSHQISLRFVSFKISSTNNERGVEDESSLLRKPLVKSSSPTVVNDSEVQVKKQKKKKKTKEEEWVDWEDQILEDTVPLVGFVRMILHSGKYDSGDRLIPEHAKTILERLLPYHPESEKKMGAGIDYITIGFHPEFENSRCLFLVRKDGVTEDFSYWKCIKGLIKKKYPLYADTFILRHFRRRRQSD